MLDAVGSTDTLAAVVSPGLSLLLAALTVLVFLVAVVLFLGWTQRRRPLAYGGLVTGADNRYSTSKFVALSWTAVVAWMVVAEAYLAINGWPSAFRASLDTASNLYFVFLGGPYAAAAIALAATQTKVAQ